MTVNWAVLEDPSIIARLVLQVFLFAASALFSMSETALFSLRETDLEKLERKKSTQAGRLRDLLAEPRQLIVSILCGNELINIAATINLAGILLALFGNPHAAAIANTAIMLPLLLVLGEITPKTLAVTKPVMLSTKLIEPALTPWVRIVMPLRASVRVVSDRITSLLIGDARGEQNILAADEFQTFLREVEKEGVVSAAERRLIANLIDASETHVTEIMVPRPQVCFIDAGQTVPEIIEAFRKLRHRRVPVYREHRDNIIGVIKEERLLELATKQGLDDIRLDDLLAPPTLVPTTLKVGELAEFFKHGDHHAVILVNEFGGVEGLVSSDDVFGYLTRGRGVYLESHGDISEPHEGVFQCAGLTPLNTLRHITNLPLEEELGVTTIGGLVMTLLGRLPEPGDHVADAGLEFKVVSMDNLLVERVLIAPEGHPVLADEGREAAQ